MKCQDSFDAGGYIELSRLQSDEFYVFIRERFRVKILNVENDFSNLIFFNSTENTEGSPYRVTLLNRETRCSDSIATLYPYQLYRYPTTLNVLKQAAIPTKSVGMPMPNPTPRAIRSEILKLPPTFAFPVLVGAKVAVE